MILSTPFVSCLEHLLTTTCRTWTCFVHHLTWHLVTSKHPRPTVLKLCTSTAPVSDINNNNMCWLWNKFQVSKYTMEWNAMLLAGLPPAVHTLMHFQQQKNYYIFSVRNPIHIGLTRFILTLFQLQSIHGEVSIIRIRKYIKGWNTGNINIFRFCIYALL